MLRLLPLLLFFIIACHNNQSDHASPDIRDLGGGECLAFRDSAGKYMVAACLSKDESATPMYGFCFADYYSDTFPGKEQLRKMQFLGQFEAANGEPGYELIFRLVHMSGSTYSQIKNDLIPIGRMVIRTPGVSIAITDTARNLRDMTRLFQATIPAKRKQSANDWQPQPSGYIKQSDVFRAF
jgi:hypothetical protein